jgi:hypothetical protein
MPGPGIESLLIIIKPPKEILMVGNKRFILIVAYVAGHENLMTGR